MGRYRFCFLFPLAVALLFNDASAQPRANSRAQDLSRASYSPFVSKQKQYESNLRKIRQGRLWAYRGWLKTGLWKHRRGQRWSTDIDNADDYFLNKKGAENPRAEMEATLWSFYFAKKNQLCRFPARFFFLQKYLRFDTSVTIRLSECKDFLNFVERMNPTSVTVVFSAYQITSPASAFGHTLIRINGAASRTGSRDAKLLDHAVTFGAEVDTENALLYGIKGLLGLFRGTFKVLPYYYKVREYNDYEARDLWEYDLALRPAEVLQLVAFLWETQRALIRYYYLSANCASVMLAALEAAAPRYRLLKFLPYPDVPSGAIRAIRKAPHLVRKVSYRPSIRTKLQAKLYRLKREEQRVALRLAREPSSSLPSQWPQDRVVAVLDTAVEILELRYAQELVFQRNSKASRIKQKLLLRRAAILIPSEEQDLKLPARKQPDLGHKIRRIGLSSGWNARHGAQLRVDFRLALHDLADASDGYPELSAIEFMRLKLNVDANDGRVSAGRSSILRILSLRPWRLFEKPISWSLDIGAGDIDDARCDRCSTFRMEGGSGLTWATHSKSFAFYIMNHAGLWAAPKVDGFGGAGLSAGIGGRSGIRIRSSPKASSFIAILASFGFLFRWRTICFGWTISFAGVWVRQIALDASFRYRQRVVETFGGLLIYL